MTKPTLEEQIEYQQRKLQDNQVNPVVTLMNSAILASLKELAAIKSQPVPVEPESVKRMRRYESGGYVQGNVKTGDVLNHIDALKSALQVAQQERDLHYMKAEALHERAEKAESELAAIRSAELPVEPVDVAVLRAHRGAGSAW